MILATLEDALKRDIRCDDAYYYRGIILKRAGHHGDAVTNFEAAVHCNAAHLDAARELQLARSRNRSRASEQPQGLVGRLLSNLPPFRGTGTR